MAQAVTAGMRGLVAVKASRDGPTLEMKVGAVESAGDAAGADHSGGNHAVNSRQNAGRPHVGGAAHRKIMRAGGIKKHDVGRVLRCSDATVYNYLTRRYPVPDDAPQPSVIASTWIREDP